MSITEHCQEIKQTVFVDDKSLLDSLILNRHFDEYLVKGDSVRLRKGNCLYRLSRDCFMMMRTFSMSYIPNLIPGIKTQTEFVADEITKFHEVC